MKKSKATKVVLPTAEASAAAREERATAFRQKVEKLYEGGEGRELSRAEVIDSIDKTMRAIALSSSSR
jgi:hypothetical protein